MGVAQKPRSWPRWVNFTPALVGHFYIGGDSKSPQAAPNMLARQFKTPAPNISWATDITYIRTQEGWLYLAVVLDLFSRQIVWLGNEATHDGRLGG